MLLNTLIFSKDRPAQLDLLLRSFLRFWTAGRENVRLTVLYKTTTPRMAEAYDAIARLYNVEFVPETSIKDDIIRLSLRGSQFCQWLVDDDVFTAPWGPDDGIFTRFRENPMITSLGLRHAPWHDFCFPMNIVTPPPLMRVDRTWLWSGLDGDWGYPNSIDGNIYRYEDVEPVVKAGKYEFVNAFEPALREACIRPLMICYETPRVMNVSANSNQTDCPTNRNGFVSPAELDARYFAGQRISIEPFIGYRARSPHFTKDYQWESQSQSISV